MNHLPTADDMTTEPDDACESCRELLGAYVLDALDQFDRGIVEQHLRWCDSCQAEFTALQTIGIGLALSAGDAGAPSPDGWSAIRARLGREDTSDDAVEPIVEPAIALSSSKSWSRWLPTAIIAPLVLAVLVLGTWSWSLQQELDRSAAELANHTLLNSTLTSSRQVQLYSMEQSCPTCDGVGQVGISKANSMGMVVGWDFDPKITHDVWGIDHNGERLPVCSLIVAQDGAVMQMFRLPDSPSRFTDIYVTDEAGNIVYTSHIADDDLSIPASPVEG